MSRKMIDANRAVFAALEDYCEALGESVQSPSAVRYVYGNSTAKRYLKYLQVGPSLSFGYHRSLSRLHLESEHFIALVGFEFEPSFDLELSLKQLTPISLDPGIGVCVLSVVGPRPIASPATIRNVVEASSADESGYSGHRIEDIGQLFPPIQLLRCDQTIDDDSCWRLFLMLSADECRRGGSWIEDDLAGAIITLAGLEMPSLPYDAVCRSMFDLDPRSLFMALYRCIEATYAYESCRKLVNKLALTTSWYDLAAALESEIGWHPREAASLNVVLKYAHEPDLAELCSLLPVDMGDSLPDSAGRAIYKLRNQIVHFRPGGQPLLDPDSVDWNRLCHLLVHIVFSVFSSAYS
jgi:hypothetical protein